MSSEFNWLVRLAWPYRRLYIAQLLAVAAACLIRLLEPLLLRWLFDEVLPDGRSDMLIVVALSFLALFASRCAFTSWSGVVDVRATERLKLDVRMKLLRHLQKLSAEHHLRASRGETLHRLEQDVDQIARLGGSTLAVILHVSLMVLISSAILFALSWQLTLLVLPIVPLMLLLRCFSRNPLRRAGDRCQEAAARRLDFVESYLANMAQLQLLNRTAAERRRLISIGRRMIKAAVDRKRIETVFSVVSEAILTLAMAVTLGYGGYLVLQGSLTIGGLVAAIGYLTKIFFPMEAFVEVYSAMHRAFAGVRRVMAVFELRPSIVDPIDPRPLANSGALSAEFRDVEFAYQRSIPVLKGLRLRVHPGEKVALVGGSGCGKTTLARLLERLYDPDSGEVLVGGVPVRELSLADLRSQVALVPQEAALFDASLAENLRCANPQASDDQLKRVLSMVQLDAVVRDLPQGLDEPIGRRGERLSRGQRQRVAIARACLRDPRLLILDEATSALDGPSEARLLGGLTDFARKRTVLIITHRSAPIDWADRVVLLDDGRAVDWDPRDGSGVHCKRLFEGALGPDAEADGELDLKESA